MRFGAAVLAAGSGSRFGGDKVGRLLAGRPVWKWSYDVFLENPRIERTVVVCRAEQLDAFRARIGDDAIRGGQDRQESAKAALEALADYDAILIHDAARPFVEGELVDRILDAVEANGAAAPFVGVVDTIRQDSGALLDRTRLMAMQTPQGARTDWLREAYAGPPQTDDAAALQAIGKTVAFVAGSADNFKITYPSDWRRAEALAGAGRSAVGLGYDVHAFSADPARPLILGGVRFEGPGLEGHSDADALTHALVDALLGAAALGDIGQRYRNDDPRWKGADSQMFLRETAALLRNLGWRIGNVDLCVIAERPKLMSKAEAVRTTLAESMEVEPSQVSLKATTNEGLGAIGRGEGLAAFAVAQLFR
jgi:2-C-methyl-D-erythritol 4-phosphate cytidylyltransferase/2-C-methyl-D-erythritol 2,4-cyclodiphosphate synthase